MTRERTHWTDCWRDHHECAVVKVERLRSDLAAARDDAERSAAAFDATTRTIRQDKGIAEAERDSALASLAATRALLEDLVAMVRGECPSLLDEDRGGTARLGIDIDAALKDAP